MSDSMLVFDRAAVRRHRDRAAEGFSNHDFLMRETAERLADRLLDVQRRFPRALDLGAHAGIFAEIVGGRGGIEWLVQSDLAPRMIGRAHGVRLAADEEFLPFAEQSFDLIVSNLSLHWVNDLPGALLQINQALKPDGFFLAALLGGDTLLELRQSLLHAEAEVEGGASLRVSPLTSVRDAGALLQRAGFALPVVDSDRIKVTYPDALRLMQELRGMGEQNAALGRRKSCTRRTTLARAAVHYAQQFADGDGRLPASFEVIYLAGWRPHDSQPRPAKRGSATRSLATVLGTAPDSSGGLPM